MPNFDAAGLGKAFREAKPAGRVVGECRPPLNEGLLPTSLMNTGEEDHVPPPILLLGYLPVAVGSRDRACRRTRFGSPRRSRQMKAELERAVAGRCPGQLINKVKSGQDGSQSVRWSLWRCDNHKGRSAWPMGVVEETIREEMGSQSGEVRTTKGSWCGPVSGVLGVEEPEQRFRWRGCPGT